MWAAWILWRNSKASAELLWDPLEGKRRYCLTTRGPCYGRQQTALSHPVLHPLFLEDDLK